MNVIIVTWGPGAVFPAYTQAVANTRVVAEQIRQLIVRLVEELGVKYEDIYLIGHSLGAHTSGHVGQLLKAKNAVIGRITGINPNVVRLEFFARSKFCGFYQFSRLLL